MPHLEAPKAALLLPRPCLSFELPRLVSLQKLSSSLANPTLTSKGSRM